VNNVWLKPEAKRQNGTPRNRWQNILKWIIQKYSGRVWTGFIWLKIRIAVQVYISPSLFVTVNRNTQNSYDVMKTETQAEMITGLSSQLHVQYLQIPVSHMVLLTRKVSSHRSLFYQARESSISSVEEIPAQPVFKDIPL
jgi:hypothetical protein